jgi:hypothetical protein
VLPAGINAAFCILLCLCWVSVLDYIRVVFNWISSLLEVPLFLNCILVDCYCWYGCCYWVILFLRYYYLNCIERSGWHYIPFNNFAFFVAVAVKVYVYENNHWNVDKDDLLYWYNINNVVFISYDPIVQYHTLTAILNDVLVFNIVCDDVVEVHVVVFNSVWWLMI